MTRRRLLPGRRVVRAARALSSSAAGDVGGYDDWLRKAAAVDGWTVDLRRRLHRQPELQYQEHATSALIQQTLHDLGVPFSAGWAVNTRQDRIPGVGGTGVVATIGSNAPDAPCVALRADIDALPIFEQTDVPFKSERDGKMHACGHDGHTAMLLGAARLLAEVEREWNTVSELGTVRLIFQPAEEGGAGAKRMCEEGVLRMEPKVDRIFGFHLWPTLPSGVVGGRAGTMLAASDKFEITIGGKGGHAAFPHLTNDPVVAGSAVVTALQTLCSRETAPLDAAVVSVTVFRSLGTDAHNVIPGEVHLKGTIRALSEDGLVRLRHRLQEVADAVAGAHRCALTNVEFAPDYYPPCVNNPDLWNEFVKEVAGPSSTDGQLVEVDTTLAGEDFAFFAQEVPGAFLLLGQGSGAEEDPAHPDTSFGLHHHQFAMHEKVLTTGVALHAHLALSSLADLQSSSSAAP